MVLTSDNPRDEAPGVILPQILAGVAGRDEVDVIEDRREAIAHALAEAAPADVVLIAGKGHEDYQEIAGVKRRFSDVDEARERRCAGARGGLHHDDAGRGPARCCPARGWSATAAWPSRACTATRAACAPATCSSR